MLNIHNTALVLVDVQEKLAQVMHEKEQLFENLQKLVAGLRVMDIPIVWMEQIPEKMGQTIPQLTELLTDLSPISKSSFGCCGEQAFSTRLEEIDKEQVIVAGIESHVCVYQTACELTMRGYLVEVVADAISSRTPLNKDIGLEKIRECGASITSTETLLFELMRTAEHPKFRDLLKIVK